ncbi:MAG: tryptophan--tRNA ligase, partial [Candidatus Moranbacteria bacterium]|nr:tryptophan--tRNA ligase [Candidatus Moranbacteria bacterium]
EVAKIYLAAGIDPEKSSIFIQSHVPEHAELTWILNTIAKTAELERMTQFKDKTQSKESIGMGLFDYPVLMAADILLYDTNLVPVGEDQLQHVELTRTLAKRFNSKFGETFVIPEPYITKESARIMGLDDPTKKMSKSAASEYNYISLTDSEEDVRRKIKKAVTDSGSEIIYSNDKPALQNLINIYSLFSEKKPQEIENIYRGKNYADFKADLAEIIIGFLKPFQEKMAELSDAEVLEILKAGAEKVRPLASQKMAEIRQKIGFIL